MQNLNPHQFLNKSLPQPKLVRPRHLARLVFILTILCQTTLFCGYSIVYIIALGTANVGIVYGSIALIPAVKAFLIASLPLGVTVGTFFLHKIITLSTRRNMIFFLCIFALILQGLLHIPFLSLLFVVRLFQGIIVGFFLGIVPIYIRQISPKQINKKGIYGIFGPLFFIIGFMLAFAFNTIMLKTKTNEYIRWRIVISINFIPILSIMICILSGIIPQSPNSYISKGLEQKAKAVIGLFHGQQFIQQLYIQKLQQIQDAKKPVLIPSDRPLIKKILTIQLPIMHQLTGVMAYISQMGFITTSFQNDFGEYVPFLMGSMQVIAALFSVAYFYRINRRRLILIGNLAMSLCCIGIGICFFFINQNANVIWAVVFFIVVFMGFNGATLVPGIMPFIAQIGTKDEIRWANIINWMAVWLSIAVFILIGNYVNYQTTFLINGVSTLICFFFNLKYLIEQKPNIKKQINIELQKLDFTRLQNKTAQNSDKKGQDQ